jgi:hypothetical protein
VRVGEENSAGSEAIKIRGDRLGMPAHASNPVIEIVEGNEENVRARILIAQSSRRGCEISNKQKQNGGKTRHFGNVT